MIVLFILKKKTDKNRWQAERQWNEGSVFFFPGHLLPSCGRETLLLTADGKPEYSQQCLDSIGSPCESLWECKWFTQMNAIHLISRMIKFHWGCTVGRCRCTFRVRQGGWFICGRTFWWGREAQRWLGWLMKYWIALLEMNRDLRIKSESVVLYTFTAMWANLSFDVLKVS